MPDPVRIYVDEQLTCPNCKNRARANQFRPVPEPEGSGFFALVFGMVLGVIVSTLALMLAGVMCL